LTKKDIEGDAIVDPAVRAAVQRKFQELAAAATSPAGADPKKLWSNRADVDRFPRLLPSGKGRGDRANSGGSIIFSVRVRTTVNAKLLSERVTERYVVGAANFAVVIYEITSVNDQKKRWVHDVVSVLEAHQNLLSVRKALSKEPPIANGDACVRGPDNANREKVLLPRSRAEFLNMPNPPFKIAPDEQLSFVCALRKNDMIELDVEDTRQFYRVQSFSIGELQLAQHFETAIRDKDRNTTNRIKNTDNLRRRHLRLVDVGPIGDIRYDSN
jgi:hypothetical protein